LEVATPHIILAWNGATYVASSERYKLKHRNKQDGISALKSPANDGRHRESRLGRLDSGSSGSDQCTTLYGPIPSSGGDQNLTGEIHQVYRFVYKHSLLTKVQEQVKLFQTVLRAAQKRAQRTPKEIASV